MGGLFTGTGWRMGTERLNQNLIQADEWRYYMISDPRCCSWTIQESYATLGRQPCICKVYVEGDLHA